MSPSTEILRSQALIEKEDGGGSTDGLSWRERLEKSQEERTVRWGNNITRRTAPRV